MHVTYTPEGGTPTRWEFRPDRVRQSEAELVEKRYGNGKTWEQFCAEVQAGSIRARRVLLWHLMRTDPAKPHPTLRFEDTPDFYVGEVKVEHDVDELLAIRERVAQSEIGEGEREQALAMVDADIAAARARGEVPEGKAPSSSGG